MDIIKKVSTSTVVSTSERGDGKSTYNEKVTARPVAEAERIKLLTSSGEWHFVEF